MTMCSPRFQLPVELEREIFEIAASAYPSCTAQLVRVAKRVQVWLTPELHRVLRSNEGRVVPPIYSSGSDNDSAPNLWAARTAHYAAKVPRIRHSGNP
ncbi:hypothetical protein B0H34DRAFT_802388 [Crassisporium funariophilum]|nr:hypothetical protein B0H34DRAFT_802388 [Crassisporium funariophilum]